MTSIARGVPVCLRHATLACRPAGRPECRLRLCMLLSLFVGQWQEIRPHHAFCFRMSSFVLSFVSMSPSRLLLRTCLRVARSESEGARYIARRSLLVARQCLLVARRCLLVARQCLLIARTLLVSSPTVLASSSTMLARSAKLFAVARSFFLVRRIKPDLAFGAWIVPIGPEKWAKWR